MQQETALAKAAHAALVVNLRNAHALEKQVVAVLEPQMKLFSDYPELHTKLSEHIVETREQTRRLEACLEACDSSASFVKDALLSVMGLSQSSVQGFADDAVLKAVTADYMTEHLEIATYRNLIVLADMAGMSSIRPRLEESLREEVAMAAWFDQNLEAITWRFVELDAANLNQDVDAVQSDATQRDGAPQQTMWQTLENANRPQNHPAAAADANDRTSADQPSDPAPRDRTETSDGNAQKERPQNSAPDSKHEKPLA